MQKFCLPFPLRIKRDKFQANCSKHSPIANSHHLRTTVMVIGFPGCCLKSNIKQTRISYSDHLRVIIQTGFKFQCCWSINFPYRYQGQQEKWKLTQRVELIFHWRAMTIAWRAWRLRNWSVLQPPVRYNCEYKKTNTHPNQSHSQNSDWREPLVWWMSPPDPHPKPS